MLNENGYPNISDETPAVLRLCTDLLYVHSTALSSGGATSDGATKGHFYTNDIKVCWSVLVMKLCCLLN